MTEEPASTPPGQPNRVGVIVLTVAVVALFVGGVALWAVQDGNGEASPTT